MIKVKCRGYEGALVSLYSDEGALVSLYSDIVQTKSLRGDTLKIAKYEIEIEISDTERVTLCAVKACEIEFM